MTTTEDCSSAANLFQYQTEMLSCFEDPGLQPGSVQSQDHDYLVMKGPQAAEATNQSCFSSG